MCDFPPELHHRIRHSNFIERTFGETRRRAKVIGHFPAETSCIGIAWAVLDRASRGWRGLTMAPAGLRQLQDLRCNLLHPTTTTPPDPGPREQHHRNHQRHGVTSLPKPEPAPPIYTGFRTPPGGSGRGLSVSASQVIR
ncbi:transposase [Mycobacterium riyadhense]|nr:transposase [Mycobacterium riyadhense]MCV7147947.1 transposase [Mycobacterium riyadhense]